MLYPAELRARERKCYFGERCVATNANGSLGRDGRGGRCEGLCEGPERLRDLRTDDDPGARAAKRPEDLGHICGLAARKQIGADDARAARVADLAVDVHRALPGMERDEGDTLTQLFHGRSGQVQDWHVEVARIAELGCLREFRREIEHGRDALLADLTGFEVAELGTDPDAGNDLVPARARAPIPPQ